MNATRKYRAMKGTIFSVAGLLIASVGLPSFARDATPDSFNMVVIEDQAYGHIIENGDYARAIARLDHGKRKRTHRFAVNNNLCVAHTLEGNNSDARFYCDRAVEARGGKRRNDDDRFNFWSKYSVDLAVALNNRAVLRAVTGDIQGAKLDLDGAISMDSGLKEPTRNMIRLTQTRLVSDVSSMSK